MAVMLYVICILIHGMKTGSLEQIQFRGAILSHLRVCYPSEWYSAYFHSFSASFKQFWKLFSCFNLHGGAAAWLPGFSIVWLTRFLKW